jgi:hypothetical protein
LLTLGLILGKVWEVPTIDIKWGEPEEIESAEIFTQSGLRNIKCYGSSMAFSNKMKQVDGVYGVATYVKHNRVKIYYDADVLNDEKIQELLFTPQKKTLKTIENDDENIYCLSIKLDNFFDSYDFSYLSVLLSQETNAIGIISEFACPVIVKIYFPEEVKNKEELYSLIESKTYTFETAQGPNKIELAYNIAGEPELFTISKDDYFATLFTPFERTFNHRTNYTNDVVKTYTIPFGENDKFKTKLTYLVSHLSNDDGVVEFTTELNNNYKEVANIAYIDSMTTVENIQNALLSDTLTISYSSGKIGKVVNMFDFAEEIKNTIQNEK